MFTRSASSRARLAGLCAGLAAALAPQASRAAEADELPAWLAAHVGTGEGQIAGPVLRRAPSLGVSVLGERHDAVARQLAARVDDRFAGLPWSVTEDGAVLVDGQRCGRHADGGECLAEHEKGVGLDGDGPGIGEHPAEDLDAVAGARADDDRVG